MIHRDLSQKYGFPSAGKSYKHYVEKESRVLENKEVKILWDFTIKTERQLEHNKPDLVILKKKKKTCCIVDVTCPFDTKIDESKRTKINQYTDLVKTSF